MKRLKWFIAGLGILFLVQTGFAQGSVPTDPNNREPEYVRRMRESREYWDRFNRGMIANRDRQPRIVPRKYPDGKPYSKEEIEQIEALKRPDEADLAKYADFLKQKKTGMFRLFPYLACIEKGLIRVDGECADFIPDSWAYSFRAKDFSIPFFFDLKYKDGNLVTGSLLSLGVLTALGDVSMENVSMTSDGMKFLAELKPETGQKESEKQIEDFVKGVESGGYQYSTKVKVEENTTYGLRVVAYRMPGDVKLLLTDKPLPRGDFNYQINRYDERDDITLAFRIIRRETDGNVTILWKELSRADAPKLVFPKGVKKIIVKQDAE
jgi:hypothetical protein